MSKRQVKEVSVADTFQGGIDATMSGVKNGLLVAMDLGIVKRDTANELLLLIREATTSLIESMNDE